MNNLKNIREIYGITQEEIAKAVQNLGYMGASVKRTTKTKIKKIKRPLVLA